jgi:hypothetical protein
VYYNYVTLYFFNHIKITYQKNFNKVVVGGVECHFLKFAGTSVGRCKFEGAKCIPPKINK